MLHENYIADMDDDIDALDKICDHMSSADLFTADPHLKRHATTALEVWMRCNRHYVSRALFLRIPSMCTVRVWLPVRCVFISARGKVNLGSDPWRNLWLLRY